MSISDQVAPQDESSPEIRGATTGQDKPPGLPSLPWSTDVSDGPSDEVFARTRWREALEPCIRELARDKINGKASGMEKVRLINGMARVLTLQEPGRVGEMSTIPASRVWTYMNDVDNQAFTYSQCSAQDRTELLRWLGRASARVNWRACGRGSSPMTAAAIAVLLNHWTAIGWLDQKFPDWCQDELHQIDGSVFPRTQTEGLFRS